MSTKILHFFHCKLVTGTYIQAAQCTHQGTRLPGPGKFRVIFWPIPCYLFANSANCRNSDRISAITQNLPIFLQNSAKKHAKTAKFVHILQILHFSIFFPSQNLQNSTLFQKANSALSVLQSPNSVLSAIK